MEFNLLENEPHKHVEWKI